jgi:hypothetical protein
MGESTGPQQGNRPQQGTAAAGKVKVAPSSNGHKKGEGVRITRKEDYQAFEVSFDEGAELGVLCSIGIDPSTYDEVATIVQPRDFFREKHQLIFRALGDIRGRGDPPDFLTLVDELETQGRLEAVGGIAELAHIYNDTHVPDAGNVLAYARIVLRHAIRRLNLRMAEVYGAMSQTEDPKWGHALALLQRALDDMRARLGGKSDELKERFRLMSDEEVERMAPPAWLVGNILPAGRLSVLFGEYGTAKSFLALDWALCVATGRPWHNHAVLQGPVVYVVGEGIGGMGQRIRAWKQRAECHGPSGLHLIGQPPQLLSTGDIDEVRKVLRTLPVPPVLVVFDTLARSMAGKNENLQEEMGLAVYNADRIRTEFGCDVLLVHHKPHGADRTRGSTVLPDGADTIVEMNKQSDGTMLLITRKQKDAAEYPSAKSPMHLRLDVVALDEEGIETSCVLSEVQPGEASRNELKPSQLTALLALFQHPDATRTGVASSDWERATGQSHSTYQDARRELNRMGLVSRLQNTNYILTPNGVRLVRSEYERGTTGPDQDSA